MHKLLTILGLLLPFLLQAQIEQWRGHNRDGIYNESELLKEWPSEGPELLLKVEGIGKGWSSAVIANNTIYVSGMIDTSDILTAIDQQGKIIWQTYYGRSWNKTFSDTRSSPTIENKKAYLSSGMGEVVCINTTSGNIEWSSNVFKNNEGETGTWGVAENILIVNDKVVFTPGGKGTTMVALNKETGEEIWKTKSLEDEIGYVSPILVEQNGIQQIISLSARNLFGINPINGEMVWTYDYLNIDDAEWGEGGAVINCTSPIYHKGELYVTSGYNHTGAKFKLKSDLSGVEFLWKDEILDNHHGGVVLVDGYLYGSNWINNNKGKWCCIDWKTGETKYETEFDTKGSIISADNLHFLYTERKGMLGIAPATPDSLTIASSFRITEGKGQHWAHPTIKDGKLYVRHGEVLLVYNISPLIPKRGNI
ncbi:MAG: PQQ-binding-like beta-propeller repeat protein [Prolixibacteraceae bacterium]|jgi:outer membrane protein assembly factor BamB|nr:PQQ-binding-like beta-propeller repeat protein [Prolixibacteraceae bacterium]